MPEPISVPRGEAEAVFGIGSIDGVEPLRPRPLGATVGVWRVRAGVQRLTLAGCSEGREIGPPLIMWSASAAAQHGLFHIRGLGRSGLVNDPSERRAPYGLSSWRLPVRSFTRTSLARAIHYSWAV